MRKKQIVVLVVLIFIAAMLGVCKIAGNSKANKYEATAEMTTESAKEIKIVFNNEEKTIVTFDEYNLLQRVCMSECGGEYGEPLYGKIAVVETILNRCKIYNKSIEEVVYEPYQYSTAYNGDPDESVQKAVNIALRENIYPDDMIYFRTDHFHYFGKPFEKIGNHYFSLKGDE